MLALRIIPYAKTSNIKRVVIKKNRFRSPPDNAEKKGIVVACACFLDKADPGKPFGSQREIS
jgi:hypothetical protein